MTDREIIQGLIDRDNSTTEQFFYVRCRPLLTAIMRAVFGCGAVEYDEMVGELYGYLMEDDAARLRQFGYRSSVYQWLKVVATRFFLHRRDSLIENTTAESPYKQRGDEERYEDTAARLGEKIDVENLLGMMDNRRYAEAIRRLVLEDAEPAAYAAQIGVSVDNLYNIKKRALAALARIAIKYYSYGR